MGSHKMIVPLQPFSFTSLLLKKRVCFKTLLVIEHMHWMWYTKLGLSLLGKWMFLPA